MRTCDAHIDVPWQMQKMGYYDLSKPHPKTMVDFPRMKQGGLDAAIFALYLSDAMQDRMSPEEADKALNKQLHHFVTDAHYYHMWLKGPRIFFGLEGGRLLHESLERLTELATWGIRYEDSPTETLHGIKYVTLTHNRNTSWADSATDVSVHNGLTQFGKKMVCEIARLGVLIDVSHASDKVCLDVLSMGVPMLASHSGCRALCNHPRNLSDELIKRIARNGGIICVPFARRFLGEFSVFEHIYRIVDLTGDSLHVGVGSDLDGAVMGYGIKDVSDWSKVTVEALRGYEELDVANIAGGNLLRLIGENKCLTQENAF